MSESAWRSEENLLRQAHDANVPFEPTPIVAECFECGYSLTGDDYVYIYDDVSYCSECAPHGSLEVAGWDV